MSPFENVAETQPNMIHLQNLNSVRRDDITDDFTGFDAGNFVDEPEFAIYGDDDSVEDPELPSFNVGYNAYADNLIGDTALNSNDMSDR